MCQDCLVAAQGFGLGASLIVAIGAQNIFVLRQALMRRHVLPVVLFCALTDAVLVIVGALGLGAIVKESRTGLLIIASAGAVFLFWYGVKALRCPHRLIPITASGRSRSICGECGEV